MGGTLGITDVEDTAVTAVPSVPLRGIDICGLERAVAKSHTGLRVFRKTGAGFYKILKPYGNVPHHCDGPDGPPPAPCMGITTVLDRDDVLGDDDRVIKAVVWDNVKVLDGAETGRVGKITEFIPGLLGDGSDDRYIVKSIDEGKFDSRLLANPTLGWDAAMWPANFLRAKDALMSAEHAITLELSASQFERYTDYVTTDDLCKLIVLPRTKTADGVSQSYCELLDAEWSASGGASGSPLADATQFVSHAWKYDIATVVTTLREWVDGDESPDDAETSCRFWFDTFVLDQHAAAAGTLPMDWFEVFKTTIAEIGHTLSIMMPWRAPINLTRAWRVYEIAVTARVDAQRTFLLPKRERDNMLTALVDEFETMAKVIAGVALQDAEGGGAEDRKQIVAIAEEVGMSDLNRIVCAALREWQAGAGRAELERREGEAVNAGTLRFVHALAKLLQAQGKMAEAEVLFHRALWGRETTLGALHPETLESVAWMAHLLQDQGRLGEAEPLVKQALEGQEATLGALHPETLTYIGNLAKLLQAQGKLDDAEPLVKRALAGQEAALGALHPETLKSVGNLAELLQAQGNLGEAETLLARVLEGMETTLGALQPQTLKSVSNLAELLLAQGKLKEAEPLYLRILKGNEAMFGPLHPNTLLSVSHLASLLQDQGKLDEAKPLAKRALEGREATLGALHPSTLIAVGNLAELLQAQGNLGEAEPLYRRTWEGLRTARGPSHQHTSATLFALVNLLKKLGRIDEARELCESGLATCRDALGEAHQDTINFVKQLAGLQ